MKWKVPSLAGTPLLVGLTMLLASPGRAAEDAAGVAFFESKIRPVLVANCYDCHSNKASKVRGGLLLDTRDGLRDGGDNGPAIVPGNPAKSLLVKSLKHDGLQMPPKKPKLSDSVVADFEAWVRMGAPDPRTAVNSAYKRMSAEEAKTFWSFQPPKLPELPGVKNASWARTDIDRFVLTKVEEKGLAPNSDASKRALLRRLTFDLVGLPPTPAEIETFLKDDSSQAVAKVVDRLLASKHFGEKWGRHWLDVARYAESNGNADNTPFPNAWRYRDYVIKSFNEDKPYDRFVTEQVAGDLLKEEDARKKDDLLVATGFLALTSKPRAQNNPDYRMDLVADQVDVTTRAVLGLTVMCARCHDHKFDYVSTKEYYALAGIFDSSQMLFGAAGRGGGKQQGGAGGFHSLSEGGEAMGLRDGRVTDCNVCIRGESNKRGEKVPRGFLGVATVSPAPAIPSSSSGRVELAQWLTRKDNPLTARVAVNRVWQTLFGRGIVTSPDNFGYLGDRPTHPELLDWLAVRFMEDGWSMKKVIRRIVLSRTYQLSSEHHVANYKNDPDNRFLWRQNLRRLEAEAIRDGMMVVGGTLKFDPPSGSASQAAGAARRPSYTLRDSPHRSIYLGLPRGAAVPEILSIFDLANPNLVVAQREVTTVPSQALFLMNSPFVAEQAKGLAKRVVDAPNLDDAGRVDLAFTLAFGRPASAKEREKVLAYVGKNASSPLWAGACHALLASAEFRYLD
jgi:hypothetical protein